MMFQRIMITVLSLGVFSAAPALKTQAPLTPDAPAGMVQATLVVGKTAEPGNVHVQTQWWISGDDMTKEGRSLASGIVVEPQKSEPIKSFSFPIRHFLANVPAGPRNMDTCGVRMGLKGSPLELRIKLGRRDAPLQEFLPNQILHMGVYQIAVKAAAYHGRVAGKVVECPAVLESGAENVLVWDAGKKQIWSVSASVKLLRAAEPEDVRECLEAFVQRSKETGSLLAGWKNRLESALHPPAVEIKP